MNVVLEESKGMPPKELTRKIFMTMATFSAEYPLVNMMDQDTIEQLMRKLPPDIVEKHVQEDSDFLQKIEEYAKDLRN